MSVCRNAFFANLRCCTQVLDGYMRWLHKHWRGATIICLDITTHQGPCVCLLPPGPGPPASKLRALRLYCWGTEVGSQPLGVGKFITSMAPQCPNLTMIQLTGVKVETLPAMPQLAHLVLENVDVCAALLASLQGLPALRTLAVIRGKWAQRRGQLRRLDLAPLTKLSRLALTHYVYDPVKEDVDRAGWDIVLPPGCKLALTTEVDAHRPETRWLARHASQLGILRLTLVNPGMRRVQEEGDCSRRSCCT